MFYHSERLYDFLASISFERVPPPVIHQAKRCLVDFFGAALAGSCDRTVNIASATARRLFKGDQATLIGTAGRTSCPGAALVNGIAAHVLEVDDGNRFAMGHPGATVIPAALALAESARLSGRDLLVSLVVGYETFGRVGRAVSPDHFARGFHPSGTCGTFAAAAACSKLLGHTKRQMACAFGLAGSQASGLFEFLSDGSMAKQLNVGHAAQSGLQAALLADGGYTGPQSILEGPRGFFQAMSGTVNAKCLSEDLGIKFHIMDTYVKMHSACRHLHTSIDAALQLRARNRTALDAVEAIVVETYQVAADLNGKDIATPLSARMSLPYCVAVSFLEGRVTPAEFAKDKLQDPRVLELMKKIDVQANNELTALVPNFRPSRVTIRFKTGDTDRVEVLLPRGEPDNPVDDDEVSNKFLSLASGCLDSGSAHDLLDVLWGIEDVQDVSALMSMCRALSGKSSRKTSSRKT